MRWPIKSRSNRGVERCFGPICAVCLAATQAAKTKAARSLASRPGTMFVHPKPEAVVSHVTH
jgi:hypothetical protein